MSNQPNNQPWRSTGKIIPAEQYQAWHDARLLLSNAQEHIDSARETARIEGYEAGIAEGRQANIRALIDTQTRAGQYLEQLDREVAAIVIALVERIIGKTPNEDQTLAAARQALSRLRKHKNVKVQVPPGEVRRFREGLQDLPPPGDDPNWISVEGDPHLDADDCIIVTDTGYIQAGIQAQLENLRQTVFDSLQSRQIEE